jgi:hypothetical protein
MIALRFWFNSRFTDQVTLTVVAGSPLAGPGVGTVLDRRLLPTCRSTAARCRHSGDSCMGFVAPIGRIGRILVHSFSLDSERTRTTSWPTVSARISALNPVVRKTIGYGTNPLGVRVAWPRWIPSGVSDRDFDLLGRVRPHTWWSRLPRDPFRHKRTPWQRVEYFRYDAMDANDWFENSRGLQKAKKGRRLFGGTLGSPAVARCIFFYASYERLRPRQPEAQIILAPMTELRE